MNVDETRGVCSFCLSRLCVYAVTVDSLNIQEAFHLLVHCNLRLVPGLVLLLVFCKKHHLFFVTGIRTDNAGKTNDRTGYLHTTPKEDKSRPAEEY